MPSLAIVAAQISINVGAALGKGLFPLVGPGGVAALRTGFAAVMLMLVARIWRARLTAAHAPWLLLCGLSLGAMNLLIYWAFARIPIGLAVAIEITGPLAIVLVTARSVRDVLWLLLGLLGLVMLVPWPGNPAGLDPAGVAFALAAAACWAFYIIFAKRASEAEGATAIAVSMMIACLITFPAGIASAGEALLQWRVVGFGIVVAALSSALPYFLEMKALERSSLRLFGVVISSAPAIAALAGYVMLGEMLTAYQWLAVVLMISASAGSALGVRPSAARPGDIPV